jgi:hypothetical protein
MTSTRGSKMVCRIHESSGSYEQRETSKVIGDRRAAIESIKMRAGRTVPQRCSARAEAGLWRC